MRRRNKQHLGGMSRVNSLNDLEPSHLSELREFHSLGRSIASRIEEYHEDSSKALRDDSQPMTMNLGYHAIPSFEPLHLHIISSDMDSDCITKRKHVVSFTSRLFFVDPEAVEQHLESAFVDAIPMAISVRGERARSVLDNAPMACLRCGRVAASVPDWKRHNQRCSPQKRGVTSRGRLNSLLGWRKQISAEESKDAIPESVPSADMESRGTKRSRSGEQE